MPISFEEYKARRNRGESDDQIFGRKPAAQEQAIPTFEQYKKMRLAGKSDSEIFPKRQTFKDRDLEDSRKDQRALYDMQRRNGALGQQQNNIGKTGEKGDESPLSTRERYIQQFTSGAGRKGTATEGQTKLDAGNAKYEERKGKKDEARADLLSAWIDLLGNGATMAQQAQSGTFMPPSQQLELTQSQAENARRIEAANRQFNEANQVEEWDGREELIKEYRRLQAGSNRANDGSTYSREERDQRIRELRAQLEAGDIAAGNGLRNYSFADDIASVTTAVPERIGSSAVNLFSNVGQLALKAGREQAAMDYENSLAAMHPFRDNTEDVQRMREEITGIPQGETEFFSKVDAVADRLEGDASLAIQKAKEGKSALGEAAVDISENVLEMGFDAGVAALTGGSALVPMFARVYGQSVGQARQAGASLEQQAGYALTSAGIEIATEMMFDGVAKIYGAGAADEITEEVIRKLDDTDTGRTLLRVMIGSAGEGAEEVVSDLLSPLAESIYKDESIKELYSQLDASDIIYDFLIGAAVGMLGSGTSLVNGQNEQANTELRMRDAGVGSVENQTSAAWDVLTGKVTPEEQRAKSERILSGEGFTKSQSKAAIDENRYEAPKVITQDDTIAALTGASEKLAEKGVKDEKLVNAIAAVALQKKAERTDAINRSAPTKQQQRLVEESELAQQIVSQLEAEAVSEENKSTVTWQDKRADIKLNGENVKIVGAEDGKVKIEQNGETKTVESKDLEGLSDGYRRLVDAASTMEGGDAMLEAYRPGQDVKAFARAWNRAYSLYGAQTEMDLQKARQYGSSTLSALTDAQLEKALALGRANAKEQGIAKRDNLTGQVEYWQGGKIDGTDYDAVTEAEARELLGDEEMSLLTDVLTKVVNVTLVKSKQGKNGKYEGAQGIFYRNGHIVLDVNAGMIDAKTGQRTIVLTAAHELTHFIRAYNPAGYKALRTFISGELARKGLSLERLTQQKMDRSSTKMNYDEAMEEVIADSCETMLTDTTTLKRFASENPAEARTIRDWLGKFLDKLNSAFKGLRAAHTEAAAMQDRVEELRRMWFDALATAHENAESGKGSAAENENRAGEYSLREFEDGTRFVDVEADQHIFDGLTAEQMAGAARRLIKQKFAGKVVGIDNTMFVNGQSANEYAHPVKNIDDAQTKEAKMRASAELDNLIDAGRNFRSAPDGRDGHVHPSAVGGFSYFDVTFKVGNQYFEGVVNIENNKMGRRFKDLTQIRNVTKDIVSSYGQNPKSKFLRDVSMDRVSQNGEEVKSSDREVSDPSDAVREQKTETGFTSSIESNGNAVFSLRTYDEAGRANLEDFLIEQVQDGNLTPDEARQMRSQMEELYEICKEYDNGKYVPFSAWSNAEVVAIDGRPVFSVVKQNGEYKLNLDFSLVCKKRRTLDAVFNEMIRRGIMNDFRMGQGSIARINEIIRDHGFEVACGLCFVDSKRYRQAMIADAFCKMYNMQVFSLMKGTGAKVDSFNFGGDATIVNTGAGIDTLADDKLNWDKVNEILRTEKKGTVKYKIAEHLKNNPQDRKLVSRGDFMSTAGFDQLKIHNPELLSLYNSKKGAGGPKAAQSDVQYLNEIIQQGQFNVKDAYEVGGVRIQSFSDYVGRLVFDYVQMVADLSAKKLPAHSYTKEFMFAQQFGLTGIKINMSLVPEVVKGVDKDHAGLDADGNYTWKDGQSFGSTVYDNHGKRLTAAEGFELAKKIQNAEGYSKNCGTIAVGVSRAHIEKMLDDPEIRMIIPYHKSGLNHLVAAMNQIDKYTDYTNVQNTREYKNGKWSRIPAAKEFNWNETLQRMQAEGKGAREAAKAYLDWCNENGYKAKFDEFAGHPNYYKLLEDFSCYDKDGTTSTPLGAVQMNFPTETDAFGSMKDLIEAGLEEDAMLQAKQEGGVDDIVDEIQATLPAWEAAHPEGKKAKAPVKLSAREVTDAIDVETETKTISEDMTEEERYEVLKDKKITVYPYNPDRFAELQKNDYEELNKLLQGEYFGKTRAFNLLRTLGKNFKTFKDYFNKDISVTFEYSISSLRHSNNKQEASETASLAKLFTVFDQVIENAIGIEAHGDRYNYTKRVKSSFEKMYVLFSAYRDGQEIIPVRAEVNIYSDKTQPKLDVVVTMSKINEADVIRDTILGESAGNSSPRSASTYMVADLLQNVNPEDTGLLKYIPDGFLDEQRLLGKQKGLEDTEEYKAKKEERKAKKSDRDVNTFTTKADIDAEISRVQDQIRDIQNAQWNAVEAAKKDPRVQEAQKKMWAAEDEKGYSGAARERIEYRRLLKQVKDELATQVPEGDLNELADRVKELKELREQFLQVTPITAAQYDKLAKHFGTTKDYSAAGFILRDGRMLDFSGKKQYGSAYAGGREIYHNEVGDVLDLPTDTSPRIDMVSNGNIRLVPEINGINLSQKPTAQQKDALRGFIEHNNGSVHVDIDNAAGRTIDSFGYFKDTSAAKILADIDRYFDTGATPRPQSDLRAFRSDRDNLGYHAGDLGKAEHLNIQGRSRGTGHFGTGTYFVGVEEKVTKDSHYGKRPQHAVDFSDYNLFKVRNDRDGYRLHDALKIIDGGINKEWIRPALQSEFNIVNPTGYYDLARSKYGEEWANGDNLLNSILEYAKDNGIDVKSLEEFKAEEGKGIDDEDLKYYYEDYVKDTLKEKISSINAEYRELMDAVFELHLLPGFTNAKIFSALQAVAEYQDVTPRNARADSYATVFMKNMGYEGVDVRGTGLDNTAYGSVIYDVKPETVAYSLRDTEAVRRQQAKDRARLDALRAEKNAKIDSVRREEIEKRRAAIKKEKAAKWAKVEETEQKYREKLKKQRDDKNESIGQAKYRDQVAEKAARLNKMLLTNSDKLHVPEVLKKPLAEFLSSIDFSSKSMLTKGTETKADVKFQNALTALNDVLARQERYINGEESAEDKLGGYLDISAESMDYLREMTENIHQMMSTGETYTVNAMTAEQLKGLSKLLSNITSAVRNMNNFMANERYATVKEAADADITYMESLGKASALEQSGISDALAWKNGTPYYVLKRFGDGGKAVFDSFARGWEKMAFNAKKIIDFTEQTYTDKEVKEWKKEIHEIELSDGSKIKMTTAQIMAFSRLLGREQAMKHIEKGGIRVGNIEQKVGKVVDTTHYHLTMDDIVKITGALTPRQLAVAKSLQQFMAKQGATWGNEVSMRRFGYNFYDEGDAYYPIRTDSNDRGMQDTEAMQNSMFRLLNLSASKSLNPKASNALIVEDIFDTFADHMADMAKLNGMGLPILDAIKWFNYKERIDLGDGEYDTRTLQGAMEQAFGDQAQRYFRTLMKDINGVTEAGDRGTDLASKFIGNYKAASVAANLRVAFLQPTSYVRAAAIIEPKYLAMAFTNRNAYKEAIANSGTAVWKSLGYYDTNISRGMREQIEHNESAKDKIVEASMTLAELGDKITWGRLWVACKMQAKARNDSLEGQSLINATADLFREVVYATQVMDSTLTRSELMRGKTLYTKAMTAFMAEPTLSYNLLMDSFSSYHLDTRRFDKAEAWRKNAKKLFTAFSTYVASAAFAAVVESAADAVRDDDNDEFWVKFLEALFGEGVTAKIRGEKTTENILKSLLSGNLAQDLTIIGKIPYVKSMISTLQGYKSKDMTSAAFDAIIDSAKIWQESAQLANGTLDKPTKVTYYGNMTEWGKVYKTLQALSQLTGIGASNLTRDVLAIWNATAGEFRPDWKIKTYQSKSERTFLNTVYETGVSWSQYDSALKNMDADGNGSVKQEEAGPYLKGEVDAGRMTEEQAQAIWAAIGPTWKKTLAEWLE